MISNSSIISKLKLKNSDSVSKFFILVFFTDHPLFIYAIFYETIIHSHCITAKHVLVPFSTAPSLTSTQTQT